jgi:DNA-binding Lrp family transcriptional regulator
MHEAGDLALANRWQRGFPLAPRPFREIGRRSDLAEEAVLEKYRRLQRDGVIDRIGPVFRPNAVGASSLAAMGVPPERLEAVARFVSEQPGVNHNYERSHAWNLWFVVTAPGNAEVQRILSRIEDATGLRVLRLPLLEEFHIDLGFDLDTRAVPRSAHSPREFPEPTPEEQSLVRQTVRGLPLLPEPYADVAGKIGSTEAQVIAGLERMLGDGRVRRIGAVIRHRRLGYQANAMVVWDVPDDLVSGIAPVLARDPAVTLCYRRARALPHWPYNLYCMVHGRERGRVLTEVERMSTAYGLERFPSAVLFSERCFAQRAARYG